MARLARSPTPRLEDYMYTAEPLNFAPALLIWLRFYQPHHRPLIPPPPTRSQLHSAGHEDSLLPRMPPVIVPTKVDP